MQSGQSCINERKSLSTIRFCDYTFRQVFDNWDRAWLKEQFESLRQRELLILSRVNDILNVASQNVIPELESVIKRISQQAKSIDNKVVDAHGPPPRPTAEG
jgi:hypothetical protein